MKFSLARHKVSADLDEFGYKHMRKHKIAVPKASKKQMKGIERVCSLIEKEGLPSYLVLKKLPGKMGSGIFLHPKAKPIKRGEVIAPYAGRVILFPKNDSGDSDYAFSMLDELHLTKEEQKLLDPKRKFHPKRVYTIDLDAEKEGNFTRFINHSEKPNVEAHLLRVGTSKGIGEIIYIACKKISPGEQLLVCYEGEDKSYWGVLKIKPMPVFPDTFRLNSSMRVIT